MRLIACIVMCLAPIEAYAAQPTRQAYCVDREGDFYPYAGEPCKSGYQLGSGTCRQANGRLVAVSKENCVAKSGTFQLPVEEGRPPLPRVAPRQ